MAQNQIQVALLQMHIEAGDPDRNFARLSELLKEAAGAAVKPDMIVFPEMWNTGYALDRIGELADPSGERTKAMVSAFCREHRINVVAGSIAEKKAGSIYNTIYAFDRNGAEIGDYSKLHLFRLMDEEKYLTGGTKRGAMTLDEVRLGAMICYDIRFPELARRLALDGTELLVVPAEWPHPRLHHWRTLLMARAIENQMFVAACNRVGTSGITSFFGHSMIIDPWGEVLAEGGEGEEIVAAAIELEAVSRVRRTIPVFEDRRPELY